MVQAPIEPGTYERDWFDVVTAFEVFEHVRDQVHEATILARLPRPGGLLYCTTPDFNSFSRRSLGPRWSVISYPEHLWYLRTAMHAPPQSGHGTPEPVPASDPGGDERVREVIERSNVLRLAKAAVNQRLSALGAGDTIKARFRRC